MPGRFFRILTPDGALSKDRFVLPPRQPPSLAADCLVVLHERTGWALTVHDTRLFPAEVGPRLDELHRHSVCHKCGRVTGVAEDQVNCPEHDGCAVHSPVSHVIDAKCH